ncbi:MAG: hypothetical protein KBT46_02875, partial [Ruminococcus sp.]|nr:hypothetical protein [Candidatus Copronaster equi]
MNLKSLFKNFPVFCISGAVAFVFVVLTFIFAKPWLGIIELIALLAGALPIIFSSKSINNKSQELLVNVSTNLN